MKLVVTTADGQVFNLDVSPDLELVNLKALVTLECPDLPSEQMELVLSGQPLVGNDKPLKYFKLKDGDVLLAALGTGGREETPVACSMRGSHNTVTGNKDQVNLDPTLFYYQLQEDPAQLEVLRQFNPALAAAFSKGLDEFKNVFEQQLLIRAEREAMRRRMKSADPFDVETQRMIQEQIRRENISNNFQTALEHHPESFVVVSMLFIKCKVNGVSLKAFIDTGAQSTIMTKACAERCNIIRLVDTTCSGIARGVGTTRILGKVHLGQIQIEKDFLASSFTVLEATEQLDFMLGLDMLKRHQCVIDLKNNVLIIGTTGTRTKFLPDSEIPTMFRT